MSTRAGPKIEFSVTLGYNIAFLDALSEPVTPGYIR